MIRKAKDIDENTPWQELTIAAEICESATSKLFKTGDWRTMTPVFVEEKCMHCMYCVPYCPDSCIPVKDDKRLDFDFNYCKGCGICYKICPFKAIDFVKEEK